MRHISSLVVFFLLSELTCGFLANASEGPTALNHRFINASDVTPRDQPVGFAENLQASHSILIPDRTGGGTCSGTFISREGHFITALHCLTSCLSSSREKIDGASTQVLKFDQRSNVGKVCLLALDPRQTVHTRHVTVVALGKGYFEQNNSALALKIDPIRYRQWIADQYAGSNDYVVVKFTETPDNHCAVLAPTTARTNDFIWALSKPVGLHRNDGYSIPGNSFLFTSGYVRSTDSDQDASGKLSQSSSCGANTGEHLSRPGFFSSSLDSAPGSSGSGVFNAQGELTGLIFTLGLKIQADCKPAYDSAHTQYFDGMTMGYSMQTIASNIQRDFGSAVANEVFNCR